ncbi:oligosaccharide flippase family protein [Thetidibacter halocola]|uniref:Oligosaccharide flippase family protein n=1 Tax=Thetidibacter halocola TaxID=2827239 RepID=A0A8J7WDU0_9RHOB|nr:oligosaccharide flippase family protein [Thetidibacter halocola]MBS0124932.1 oligosaccharide flippase family protein [Thetidibacter halocola]
MASQVFDLRRLRRSFLGVSGLYLLGIPLMLLANIVLARTLSVAEFGAFGFAISLATVLAIPVSGGLPMLLTREVATYSQKTDWPAYRGLIVAAHRWVAAISAVIALGLLTWWLTAGGVPTGPLLIGFLLVPFLGLNGIRAGILKGLGRPMLAEAPTQILQPALMILGYLGLAWLGLSSAIHAMWWYLCVVIVVFGLASVMLWQVQPSQVHGAMSDLGDLPRWRRSILPFVLMSAATVLSTQIAVLLLGFSGQEEAVAQMRVAERGAQMVALPLTFINSILGPYFVQAMTAQEAGALRRITLQSARLTLAASLPVALILVLFGRSLIGWTFGAPYDALSYLPMATLIAAQVLSVALGNGGMLLAMGGHERQTLYSLVLSLAVNAMLCLLLIGTYGAMGAAIGAAAGIVTAKLYVYVVVRRLFGFSSGVA